MTKTNNDQQVITAMGSKFAEFQKLAKMVAEQPATRKYAESQMAIMLNAMTSVERQALRQALLNAGAFKHQR